MTAGSNQTEFLSLGRKLAADGKTHVRRKRDQSATFSLQCPVPDVGAQGIALSALGVHRVLSPMDGGMWKGSLGLVFKALAADRLAKLRILA